MKTSKLIMNEKDTDRIIEMAWEDRTPFEAIEFQFGLNEKAVITLMRQQLKESSFKLWRKRAQHISHKHLKKQPNHMLTFKCNAQRQITLNKISKR